MGCGQGGSAWGAHTLEFHWEQGLLFTGNSGLGESRACSGAGKLPGPWPAQQREGGSSSQPPQKELKVPGTEKTARDPAAQAASFQKGMSSVTKQDTGKSLKAYSSHISKKLDETFLD